MSAAGYAAVSTTSLLVVGVVTYFAWGNTGRHPTDSATPATDSATAVPHQWVVVLYALAATAGIGSALCGGWNVIRDVIRAVRLEGTLTLPWMTMLGLNLLVIRIRRDQRMMEQVIQEMKESAERTEQELQELKESAERTEQELQELKESAERTEQEVQELKESAEMAEQEVQEMKEEIARLNTELDNLPPPVPLARAVTAIVLAVLTILFGTAASILWAGDFA